MATRGFGAGLVRWCARVALLLTLALPAQARDRDLGPIPIDGPQAIATLPDRAVRTISELACGSEASYMAELRNPPDNRPLSAMVAKAAAFAGNTSPDYVCAITQNFEPDEWNSNFEREAELTAKLHRPPLGPPVTLADNSWPVLVAAVRQLDGDITGRAGALADWQLRATVNAREIARLLNRVEGVIYGPMCANVLRDVTPIVREAPDGGRGFVEYRLSWLIAADCLQQQIDTLILARDFQRTTNPGTGGLPCVLLGKTEGDWDMAVAQLTRATFLLRQGYARRVPITDNTRAAMDKLQTRLLTLSGPPAVAVHSIAKCGNTDNQYGSARQRLDDETFYDAELGREVEGDGDGGDSFLDFLGGLLLFLAILLAGALLAAAAAILTALLGPILAAIIMAVAAVIAAIEGVPQTILGAVFGGIEETENHLFMQNSSKYLKNKMLMEELFGAGDEDGIEEYEAFQSDLHDWFMARLQRIAGEDFSEYNAKPYARLTVSSLLNLHDFSCEAGYRQQRAPEFPEKCSDTDRKLVNGAALVLDMTNAKAALGSNQARRLVPFRRLAHTNTSYTTGRLDGGVRGQPYRLMEFGREADHMNAAMQLWTGMTFHGPGGHASTQSLGEMLWEATSRYRPHALIVDLAIDKSVPWQQTFRHAGWERYSSGPGWLLTAGGTSTGYAQGFVNPFGKTYPELFIKQTDRGAGVPTTLIPTSGWRMGPCEIPGGCMPERRAAGERQDLWADFIRFEGVRETWKKDDDDEPRTFDRNFCVEGSFACGINLQIPPALRDCLVPSGGVETASYRVFLIGDSADKDRCRLWNDENAANDFYVILYSQPCAGSGSACGRGGQWGFLEIVPRSRFPDRAALAQAVLAANAGNFDAMGRSGGGGTATYASQTMGAIVFDPAGSFVRSVGGSARDDSAEPGWPRAQGNIFNRTGDYRYTIANPRLGQTIVLDFSDRGDPKRVLP